MSRNKKTPPKQMHDEYHNLHYLGDEIARGGQGVVFRTSDADLAIKQPLDASGNPDKNVDLRERFQSIRLLPLPPRIQISLPLAILRDEPGYVMRLLSGMKPYVAFELDGRTKKTLEKLITENRLNLPRWLAEIPGHAALHLYHYSTTGSTRRRLFVLSKCASILARLHAAGLIYGDISPNNLFFGQGDSPEVWLIDADNIRFELRHGGKAVYTPQYGAPEIVQGRDASRPRTDCWAFAVMAFRSLSGSHPFIGKKVVTPGEDESGWDAEQVAGSDPPDFDEQAYAGYLPFIDDEEDDSNEGVAGLPRALIATQELRRLFQETFCAGRKQPHRRPLMGIWALELTRAFDLSLECRKCKMSYFAKENKQCPYCAEPRPAFIRARTQRWEVLIPDDAAEFTLPHRLFHPFSFEHSNDPEYEAVPDFEAKSISPVRGTKPFPDNLTFEFMDAEK